MNISKNLLSLGLIAVISGVSTAQTYTATAGTNGTTDIQSDYSMSTGDGASVSVDVPLEFELPKKVAIALIDDTTQTHTTNTLFADMSMYHPGRKTTTLSLVPQSTGSDRSSSWVGYRGGIYANTEVTVTSSVTKYLHETDPNSEFDINDHFFGVCEKICTGFSAPNKYTVAYDINTPITHTLSFTDVLNDSNLSTFLVYTYPKLSTIDTTDRAGKYTQMATITVSTL